MMNHPKFIVLSEDPMATRSIVLGYSKREKPFGRMNIYSLKRPVEYGSEVEKSNLDELLCSIAFYRPEIIKRLGEGLLNLYAEMTKEEPRHKKLKQLSTKELAAFFAGQESTCPKPKDPYECDNESCEECWETYLSECGDL